MVFKSIFGGTPNQEESALKLDVAKRHAILHKEQGNALFKAKDYNGCIREYTEGIDGFPFDENGNPAVVVMPHPNAKQKERNILAVLFSNRAAAFTALGRFDLACKDAEMCIMMEVEWSKGYVRKAKALLGLQRYKDAAIMYAKAVECESKARAQEKERHDKEIECLRQQNETNNTAYLGLLDKVKMLESQLEDYQLVFGSAGKKRA